MSNPDLIASADTVTLRPTGVGRYLEATFLAIWLSFWAIGEAIVLAVLGSMLAALFGFLRDSGLTRLGRSVIDRAPGFELGFIAMYLFLLLWLTLWTFGGLAALYSFLRLLFGRDQLTVDGGVLELAWRAGPIGRTRRFDRDRIRRIRIRAHDKAVVADMVSGTVTLSDLGTAAERAAACDWLRRRLGVEEVPQQSFDPLDAPLGWRARRGDSGAIHLWRPTTGRPTAAAIMGLLTAVALYAWYVDIERNGVRSWWPGLAIALLALAAAWVAWSREEWVVRPQQLEYRLRFGPFARVQTFDHARLEITSYTDSDGDTRYKLLVRDDTRKRTITSSMFDGTEVLDCARWMEAATGFKLTR